MDRGLYIAASGMLAEQIRQDQIANDLANASTPGYKSDRTTQRTFNDLLLQNSATGATVGPQSTAVQVFDSQGNFIRGWGRHEMGAANFSLPSGIAIDSQGHVIVTDELRHQVKIFSSTGTLLHQFGGLGEGSGQLLP